MVCAAARSYPKKQTNAFNSWTQYAFVNITQTWASYVQGGGIKAVFGEWTLAGALPELFERQQRGWAWYQTMELRSFLAQSERSSVHGIL